MKDRDGVEIVIERDRVGKPIEPRCPEPGCHALVDRPKCLFEFGSACPRHPYRLAYIEAMRQWANDELYGPAKQTDEVSEPSPEKLEKIAKKHESFDTEFPGICVDIRAAASAWAAERARQKELNHLQEVEKGDFRRAHGELVRQLLAAQARIEALMVLHKAIGTCPGPAILGLGRGVNEAWQKCRMLVPEGEHDTRLETPTLAALSLLFDDVSRRLACPEYRQIALERIRQDNKWGEQNHDDWKWLAILVEEVGEAAEAMLKALEKGGDPATVQKEVIEAGAVTLAWLESIHRRALATKEERDHETAE